MITLAAVAAKEAAFTTSAGAVVLGFPRGAVDGFGMGVLAMGTLVLAFAVPRLLRRRARRPTRDGMWGTGVRRSRAKRDYYAGPGDAATDSHPDLAERFAPEAEVLAGGDAGCPALEDLPPFETGADEESFWLGTSHDQSGRDQPGLPGHRSKHRLTSPEADLRAEARHAAPRHAAPAPGLVSRMSGRSTPVPLAARG